MTSTLKLGSKIPISEIEGDIATNDDLSLKANTSMNNIPAAGKEEVNAWGMPDYTKGVSKTWNANNIAETNGWIYATVGSVMTQAAGVQSYINIDNQLLRIGEYSAPGTTFFHSRICPVRKGSVYKIHINITGSASINSRELKFYPCIGEGV